MNIPTRVMVMIKQMRVCAFTKTVPVFITDLLAF